MVSKNLSVCLSVVNFDPNYLGTGRTKCAEKFFRTSLAKRMCCKIFIIRESGWLGRGWGPKQQHFDPILKFILKILGMQNHSSIRPNGPTLLYCVCVPSLNCHFNSCRVYPTVTMTHLGWVCIWSLCICYYNYFSNVPYPQTLSNNFKTISQNYLWAHSWTWK